MRDRKIGAERLARIVAESLARHQSRGLVDGATGMADVVIHGRVNLLAVADDVLIAATAQIRPARKSWAGWFLCRSDAQREAHRREREREALRNQLEASPDSAQTAILRLRMRELGEP